jgi:DNA-binding MarR family transcriptional regulator
MIFQGMKKISSIGLLLKKLYKIYGLELTQYLHGRGFSDLGPGPIEVMIFICNNETPSIKKIATALDLKKQTMTGHVNELIAKGYINKESGSKDKRISVIRLTDFGERFKLNLSEGIEHLEKRYTELVGSVELERMEHILNHFYEKVGQQEIKLPQDIENEQLRLF